MDDKAVEKKLKIQWLTPDIDAIANAYGYAHHNRMMRKFTEPYIEMDESAPIALQIVPADLYRPVPGKVNVLFTMWEMLDVPQSYKPALAAADAIIVPCAFCRDLFRPHTTKPIYVCREGVDESLYHYKERRIPGSGKKFRFLWVGAPNPRKGYPFILEAVKVIEAAPNVEIYIKTTVPKMNFASFIKSVRTHWKDIIFDRGEAGKFKRRSLASVARRLPKPYYEGELKVMGKHKNIFYDTRKLPLEDLIKLYESAHCFLLPTLGEGWGLTLCEAMATGAPAIATAVTGCKDFFDDEVGYSLKYGVAEQDLTQTYKMKARSYVPDTADLIRKMLLVMKNYPEAIKKGKKASDRIRSKFTWAQSGKRLYEILTEIQKGGNVS